VCKNAAKDVAETKRVVKYKDVAETRRVVSVRSKIEDLGRSLLSIEA
jgi:hypothetical protein